MVSRSSWELSDQAGESDIFLSRIISTSVAERGSANNTLWPG
jgi:hypothetical protein